MAKLSDVTKRLSHSATFKTLAVFASANMIVAIVQGVAGLLQARWVGPEVLGEFKRFNIPSAYASIALVLVEDGFLRQFPYLMGKGDEKGANEVASVAKCWYLFVFSILASLFGVLSVYSLFNGDYISAVGWAAQIVLCLSQTFGTFVQNIYRRSMEFKRLSYNNLQTLWVSVIGLFLVKFLGYYGVAMRTCCISAIRLFLDLRHIPLRVKAEWSKGRFLDLVKISIPLSGIGYIRTSFLSATFSFLVLKYCGKEDLGIYAAAGMFQGFAMMFNSALNQIFNVKIATNYGLSDDSISKCVRPLWAPTLFSFCSALFLGLALSAVISPVIHILLPRYINAIPVIYVLAIGMPLSALGLPIGILKTALRYKTIYFIGICKVMTVVVFVAVFPKTIVWLAAAMIIGEAADVFLGYIFLFHLIRSKQ